MVAKLTTLTKKGLIGEFFVDVVVFDVFVLCVVVGALLDGRVLGSPRGVAAPLRRVGHVGFVELGD